MDRDIALNPLVVFVMQKIQELLTGLHINNQHTIIDDTSNLQSDNRQQQLINHQVFYSRNVHTMKTKTD